MMRLTIALIATSATLAACSEQPTAEPPVAAANAAAPEMADEAVKASGTGTVAAIDPAAGKITLDHAPMPEIGWPAMTMGFEAEPEMIDGIAVGDNVEFEMTMSDGVAKVTSIRSQ